MAPCTRFYYQCEVTQPCGIDLYRGVAYNTYCGSSFANNSLVAYPNPANSELNIDIKNLSSDMDVTDVPGNSYENYKVSLYNEKGKVLKSGISIKGKIKISTADIPNGIYFLHVINGDDIIKKQKIIINH